MPNRIVREGILDSRAVNLLSEPGEVLYRRLMSIVDDYGRYEFDFDKIRARCFPLQLDRWENGRIERHLTEISSIGLVLVYQSGSKKYIQISNFEQRIQSKPKFPDPPDSTGTPNNQPLTTVRHGDPPPRARDEYVSVSDNDSVIVHDFNGNGKNQIAADFPPEKNVAPSERFEEVWQSWPRKTGRDRACRDWISVVSVDNESAVMECVGRYLSSAEVIERKAVRNLGSNDQRIGWLIDASKDGWKSDWPKANGHNHQPKTPLFETKPTDRQERRA